ncbi:MAG: hypothetical protein WC807_07150 [Hyphomicrobium sp.]
MAAIGVLLTLRRPDSLWNAQLWAEDGTIFLQQHIDFGLRSIFTPHAGYLLFVPRLIAAFAAELFPLQYVPLAYNLLSLIVAALALSRISVSGLPIAAPYLLAIFAVLVPHGGEIFNNITNLQWILALLMFVLLVEGHARDIRTNWINVILVIAVGLTGPFGVIYLPAVTLLWTFDHRYRQSRPVVVAYLSTIVAQGISLAGGGAANDRSLSLGSLIQWFSSELMLPLFGVNAGVSSNPVNQSIAAVASFVVLISPVLVRQQLASLVLATLASSLSLVMASALKLGDQVLPMIGAFSGGQRYTYVPYVLFSWCLIFVAIEPKHQIIRWSALLGLLLILIVSLSRFAAPAMLDLKWNEHVSVPRSETIEVLINPGWKLRIPPNR